VKAERRDPRLLYLLRSDVMEREAPEAGAEHFPDTFEVGGNALPLTYKFEPTQRDDGVTLVVPEPLLDLLDAERLAWLVPGMLLEKITEILRALPKAQRKLFVPVPDSARAILSELPATALPPFHEWLAKIVTRRAGETLTAAQLAALPIADYLRMNVRVVDENDVVVAEGRDLLDVRREQREATPADPSSPNGATLPSEHR